MNTVIHFIRKRDEELRQWSVSKEPRILFLSGAPRVGKSHLASWMGKNLFNDDFMSVDCADRKHSEQIIGISSNLGGVTAAVAQRYGRKVVPSKTLLFFDNIHRYPEAIKALGALSEECPQLHIAIGGTPNGVVNRSLKALRGALTTHRVRPLCFEEFLVAHNKAQLAQLISNGPQVVTPGEHSQLMHVLAKYFLIGGMPECVRAALKGDKALSEVYLIQKNIVETLEKFSYPDDISARSVTQVLRGCAGKIGESTYYQGIANNLDISTVKRAIDVLVMSHVMSKISPTSPDLGGMINVKQRVFRTLELDIGILRSIRAIGEESAFSPDSALTQPALLDQFIGQELLHSQGDNLLFWASSVRGSSAYVDYLAHIDNAMYPICFSRSESYSANYASEVYQALYPSCPGAIDFTFNSYQGSFSDSGSFLLPIYTVYSIAGGAKASPTILLKPKKATPSTS